MQDETEIKIKEPKFPRRHGPQGWQGRCGHATLFERWWCYFDRLLLYIPRQNQDSHVWLAFVSSPRSPNSDFLLFEPVVGWSLFAKISSAACCTKMRSNVPLQMTSSFGAQAAEHHSFRLERWPCKSRHNNEPSNKDASSNKKLLVTKGISSNKCLTSSNKKLLGLLASLLGTRTLLGAPGHTTRNKKLLGAFSI